VVTVVTHTALFRHYYEGVAFNCMNTAIFWFTILLCVVILLVPVLAEKFYYVDTRPTLTDKVIALRPHRRKYWEGWWAWKGIGLGSDYMSKRDYQLGRGAQPQLAPCVHDRQYLAASLCVA